MRFWLTFLALVALILSGCAPISSTDPSDEDISYPDMGPASELTSDVWLNTDKILRLSDLRGKVILIDMWTFG